MKYELVIIWASGEIQTYPFSNEQSAEETGLNMKAVFGNQIEWIGVKRGSK